MGSQANSHNDFTITKEKILDAYRLKCKNSEYEKCLAYLQFKPANNLNAESKKLGVPKGTLLTWKKKERVPRGIQTLNFLENSELLPFKPNARTARIVGYMQGDGFLLNELDGFGIVSSDLDALKKLQEEFKVEFHVEMELKEKRREGEEEIVLGRKIKATKPTYVLLYNNGPISCLLYALGLPKGKKTQQRFSVPDWIVDGGKEIKQGFLQGLFDAELSSPQVTNCGSHKQGIPRLRLQLSKIRELLPSQLAYSLQIARLLHDLGIETSRITVEETEANPTIVLYISNSLKNLLEFAKAELFYYSEYKKQKTEKIKELVLRKNKRSKIFAALEIIKNKERFTTYDFVRELGISESYSKSIGKYLYYCGFASRKRAKNGWLIYYPKREKIEETLDKEFPKEIPIRTIILQKTGNKACDGHE